MPYYHELITEQSWKLLQELKRRHTFILIGGWAVFLYTKALKSKDIDIICDFPELEALREHHALRKNDRLKKYEIATGEVDIDIYVPFFSDLGIPVEEVQRHTTTREGFVVPTTEVLLALKCKAWLDRGHTLKGEKDRIDVISLLRAGVDLAEFTELLARFGLNHYRETLRTLLIETREIPELGMNVHQYARFKRVILPKL